MSVFMLILTIGIAVPAVSLFLSILFDSLEGLFHLMHFSDFGDFGGHGGLGQHGDFGANGDLPGHTGHIHSDACVGVHPAGDPEPKLFGIGSSNVLVSLLPASPVIWCVLLIVTGAVGETLFRFSALRLLFIWQISLAAGYALMLVIYNGILMPLKRARNFANDASDFRGRSAQTVEAILEGGVGAVRLTGVSGTVIYAAVSEGEAKIPQGETVVIERFENGRAVVSHRTGN